MKLPTLLYTASFLTLIQYVAHAYLFLSAVSPQDKTFGYGLMVILSGFIATILLWQLARLATVEPFRTRPFVALLMFANVAHACLAWAFFRLAAPVAFDLLIAVVLGFALGGMGRRVAS